MSTAVLWPSFDWVLFFCCWGLWTVCIFWKLNPCQSLLCKYFLPFCRLPFILFFLVSFSVQKLVTIYSCSLLRVCISYFLTPILSTPPTVVTISLSSISVSLILFCYTHWCVVFLDSIYMRYYTVFVITYLTCFTWHNTLQVHPCCCKWQFFIIFYDWVGSHRVRHDWSDLQVAVAVFTLCVCVCVCVCVWDIHLLYPFICWWTFQLLP